MSISRKKVAVLVLAAMMAATGAFAASATVATSDAHAAPIDVGQTGVD